MNRELPNLTEMAHKAIENTVADYTLSNETAKNLFNEIALFVAQNCDTENSTLEEFNDTKTRITCRTHFIGAFSVLSTSLSENELHEELKNTQEIADNLHQYEYTEALISFISTYVHVCHLRSMSKVFNNFFMLFIEDSDNSEGEYNEH
jgi:hypothetical protein